MSNFKIAVTPTGTQVTLSQTVEEVDVIDKLTFNEDLLEELLETHSATQAYWEALAVRMKKGIEAFDEEFARKWWAHNRVYAKLVLNAYGEKEPTKTSVDDMTILIYTEDSTDSMRSKYAHLAHTAFGEKKHMYAEAKKTFEKNMYKYLNEVDPPWYVESVMRTQRKLKEDYELVKVFAERLNSRGFQMKEYQSLLMAKRYNIGTPISQRDTMERVSQERQRRD